MRSEIRNLVRRGIIALCFLPVLYGLAKAITAPSEPVIVHERFEPAVTLKGMPELRWTADLDAALCEATRDRKLVFVVFDAQTDTNARHNEITVFARQDVRRLLKRYVLVKLYLDRVPDAFYRQTPTEKQGLEDAEANRNFENATFFTEVTPFYVILAPADSGRFEVIDKIR